VEDFLIQYGPLVGYFILLLGSFVEGESVVLTAGFFAYKGYLSLPLIMLIAFIGSVTADQIIFFLGRAYGPGWLAKKPHLKVKADKAFALLIKYNIWFIMGFRFIYGIRTISPFVIGTSGISVKRFAILNIIAGVIWAVISCLLGYMLGYWFADEIEYAIKLAIKSQKIIVTVLILAVIGIATWSYYRKKQNPKNSIDPDQSNR
jgi:membrane protein DedA with SNARE-associated domain